MPRKNISDMLHRSVAGAVLLSICHFAAAEAVNTKPDKFNFWESEDLTWWSEESTEEETEKFLSAFSQGTPVLTNVEWDVAEQLINDLQEDLPKLKYGFINEGVESALLTFSSHHVSISSSEPITINRELDLKILDVNHEGSASRVLGIQTIPDSQFQVNFEKAVNLEIQRLNGTGFLAISVADGTELHFLDKLTVKDYSSAPALLVQVGEHTRNSVRSLFQLSGPSSFKTLGTAFNLESSACLKASSSLNIEAGKVFTGNGKVIADGAEVYLKGDLGDFGGIYQQIGGTLEIVSDTQLKHESWNLADVQFTSESKNIFTVSAKDFVSDMSVGATLLFGEIAEKWSKPFSKITLTDEKASLEYLNKASDAYKKAELIFTGEVFIDENSGYIHKVTLNNHYGLLDKPNMALASVRLDLEGSDKLTGQTIRIGSLTSGNTNHLKLNNSDIALYAPGPVAAIDEKIKIVGLTNSSSLTIHGITEESRGKTGKAHLTAAVYVEDGSKLNFSGSVLTFENALIVNEGETNFKELSNTELHASLYQTAGKLDVGAGAEVLSDKSVEVTGGGMNVAGVLTSNTLVVQNAEANVAGSLKTGTLTLGTKNKGLSQTTLSLTKGGQAQFDQAEIFGSNISIGGAPDSEQKASLYLKKWEGRDNQIKVANGGVLILGDDASGDGNGYGVPETLSILEQFGNPSKAVLVVNETQVLGNGDIIRLGNAATRAGETGVVFGGGSALLMRGRADAPVFTSAADGSLSFQPNSSIFVVDPFGSNQLTDTTVSEINGRSDVNLVSLNPNLSLKLENVAGEGWFIKHGEINSQNFVYPELQGWLYDNPEGFTVDSLNAAQKFFARVDNEAYFNPQQSHKLIKEATQLGSLLGTRLNTLRVRGESMKKTLGELHTIMEKKEPGIYMFGDVGGGLFFSNNLGGYLGSSRYRATSETVRIGAAGKNAAGLSWSVSLDGGHVSSKSRHTVLDASGKQNIFGLSLSVGKRFEKISAALNGSVGHSKGKITSSLPGSMQMDKLKTRVPETLFNVGGDVAYALTDELSIAASPQLWVFPKATEKTSIGSQNAFRLKNKAQVFAEVPLSLRGSWTIPSAADTKIRLKGELGGSVKVGKLSKESRLFAVGTEAKEDISQKNFRRWNGFGTMAVSVKQGRFEGGLAASAATGDGKLDAALTARANWNF